jgi:hypothetical protein
MVEIGGRFECSERLTFMRFIGRKSRQSFFSMPLSGFYLKVLRITGANILRSSDVLGMYRMPYRFNSLLASVNFSIANSISFRLWAADIWVRMRALPCGTTGYENATT